VLRRDSRLRLVHIDKNKNSWKLPKRLEFRCDAIINFCIYNTVSFFLAACNINSDIFFVLDSSGSIGAQDFREVRSFVHEFVNSIRIGPDDNQVGVISFSDTARVDFYLNSSA